MVTVKIKYNKEENANQEKDPLFLPTPFTYGSIPLSQISSNQSRLDASAYNIVAMNALTDVRNNKYGWTYLWGDNGLIDKAYYPGRYKRIYCSQRNGIPFFLPSQLDEIYPKPTKYISVKTAKLLTDDCIKPNMLLISRSGTIGKCAISSRTTIGKLFSDDVIRTTFKHEYDLGYVYAFLHTPIGLSILQSNNYGAVIDHIEPEHLRNIPIPNAPKDTRERIHHLVIDSYDLRDQSNEFIDKAQEMLYKELDLPELSTIKPKQYANNAGFRNYSIKSSQLDGRLDASYHLPELETIIYAISKNAAEVTNLGDKRISKGLFVGNRFKRVYVKKGKGGIIYLNGKSINQLDPNGCQKQYLSFIQHEEQIKEQLTLFTNYILITCSGTLGRVILVPKHWNNWVGTHDLIRLIPKDDSIAGFLFCYLNSEIGKTLIQRYAYGAVVDHIEPIHIKDLPTPLLKDKNVQQEINDLVLYANDLRYQAYLKEQEALDLMNNILNEKRY